MLLSDIVLTVDVMILCTAAAEVRFICNQVKILGTSRKAIILFIYIYKWGIDYVIYTDFAIQFKVQSNSKFVKLNT